MSTLVRLVRRARLVEIHEAPSTPMPFRLRARACEFVCVRVRVCLQACVLTFTLLGAHLPKRRRLGSAITGSGGLPRV